MVKIRGEGVAAGTEREGRDTPCTNNSLGLFFKWELASEEEVAQRKKAARHALTDSLVKN